VVLNEGAERLTVVPELARRYPHARILFSGGSSALIDGDAEAKFAWPLLESLGIARDRITVEDHSRNTVENAVYSNGIVQPKPSEEKHEPVSDIDTVVVDSVKFACPLKTYRSLTARPPQKIVPPRPRIP
jgi:hypothetical protein